MKTLTPLPFILVTIMYLPIVADGFQYIWGNGSGTIDLTYSFTSAETFNLDDPYWDLFMLTQTI